jgi:hypothetical protein
LSDNGTVVGADDRHSSGSRHQAGPDTGNGRAHPAAGPFQLPTCDPVKVWSAGRRSRRHHQLSRTESHVRRGTDETSCRQTMALRRLLALAGAGRPAWVVTVSLSVGFLWGPSCSVRTCGRSVGKGRLPFKAAGDGEGSAAPGFFPVLSMIGHPSGQGPWWWMSVRAGQVQWSRVRASRRCRRAVSPWRSSRPGCAAVRR